MDQLTERNLIFALDIGTRSVIGIVGYQDGDLFRVCCTEREEYKNRAVVDGQIEDIEETAKITGLVKERLEQKLGFPLKTVYIAAAGRVLKTMESSHEAPVPEGEAITGEFVAKLELGAIQKAYGRLETEGDGQGDAFFCVGHAVRGYRLDGYPISTLLGHRGKTAEVSQIVTFLPREVMESLYATMALIGLTVSGLTLEPIAAMNAIIPPDLRKLNLALCDIGAGTSDIALCDRGSVSAYTMATVAGDEITEEVMRACLVDFQTAEQIKMQLSADMNAPVTFDNILGFSQTIPGEEIYRMICPAIEKLASVICEEIAQTNGKAPAAVFLVGGGSRTPTLQTLVAQALGLDEKHVAVGGNVYIRRMITAEENLLSPEYATPLGIAITAASQRAYDSFVVTVNDRKLHLFNLWDTSVLGVLQMSGYRYRQLMGKAGASISYTLNGERRVAWGKPARPAEVMLRGAPAALTDTVQPGDVLTFTPAECGEDAALTLSDLADVFSRFTVTLEGQPVSVGRFATVNGVPQEKDYAIKSGDEIVLTRIATVGQLCAAVGVSLDGQAALVNGIPRGEEYALAAGDAVSLVPADEYPPAPAANAPVSRPVREPEAPSVGAPPLESTHDSTASQPRALIIELNGRPLRLPPREGGLPYQFFDLLPYADIDPQNPQGQIVQMLNGQPASYIKELQDGDCAEIFWNNSI